MVPIYGQIIATEDTAGQYNPLWLDWQMLIGIPHDLPIAGYGGRTVNTLRLFSARSAGDLDMQHFNAGDYVGAVEDSVRSETVSKVLYPNDSVAQGRELRLIQEYFLSACAVRDVVRRCLREHGTIEALGESAAFQLNDTHPALIVAELMRILVDEHAVAWEPAWELTQATTAYTNHTLMPEALERWPVALLAHVIPRHLEIIYEINRRFLEMRSAHGTGAATILAISSTPTRPCGGSSRQSPRARSRPARRTCFARSTIGCAGMVMCTSCSPTLRRTARPATAPRLRMSIARAGCAWRSGTRHGPVRSPATGRSANTHLTSGRSPPGEPARQMAPRRHHAESSQGHPSGGRSWSRPRTSMTRDAAASLDPALTGPSRRSAAGCRRPGPIASTGL